MFRRTPQKMKLAFVVVQRAKTKNDMNKYNGA